MPANLLLLPLLGGYWFLHTFYYTRFRSQRLDGYRLLLESAMVGVLLAGVAWILARAASWCPCVAAFWGITAPNIPYLGTAMISVVVGFVSPMALNLVLSQTGLMTREDAQRKAIDRYGNHLLRLLHSATAQEKMVSVALDCRKVYIGFVAAAPNLESHDAFFSITPFFSGYRDAATIDLVLTVDYLRVYEREHLVPQDFNVTVPIASVRMASYFDQKVYPAFLVESDDAPHESTSPAIAQA